MACNFYITKLKWPCVIFCFHTRISFSVGVLAILSIPLHLPLHTQRPAFLPLNAFWCFSEAYSSLSIFSLLFGTLCRAHPDMLKPWCCLKLIVQGCRTEAATLRAPSRISNLFLAVISAQGQHSLQSVSHSSYWTSAVQNQGKAGAAGLTETCQTSKLHQTHPSVPLLTWNWLQEGK